MEKTLTGPLRIICHQNLELCNMILPAKLDINKAKAAERKIEIDNGIALAKQIDSLRSTFAQERVAHSRWKESSMEALNRDLQELQDGIDAKKKEITMLDEQKSKLQEPLNLEWENVNAEKLKVIELKHDLFLDQERNKEDKNSLDNEKQLVTQSLKRIKENEEKTEKLLISAEKLEKVKQIAYQETIDYKSSQEVYHQNRRRILEERIKEYEVALRTIEIREQEVKDKESELLEREILLKDRQAMFERNLTRN